ncbi:MAG: M23 family metallopeptidase [Clostridia bacterium]|nr:M23 family metallopeptidase [Clostridia bacterium]
MIMHLGGRYMVYRINKPKAIMFAVVLLSLITGLCLLLSFARAQSTESEKSYIKWFEFNVCLSALEDAMELDIETYDKLYHISWIDTLSYLACKNGNSWSKYSSKDIDSMLKKLGDIYTVDDLMNNKYYSFYKQAFTATLGGILGEYEKQAPDGEGGKKIVSGYGMVAYSPLAEGFGFSHSDDFGNERSYGYKRQHLGHDMLGYVGTPVVAVEGGTVECIGWNQYGGWRLGIRSFDGKRSYYYAHLRKDSPYAKGIVAGSQVKAGQVIGYMGMTGYSTKSNVNGMSVPHLHIGLQLIFDESQKEGTNQIWLDVYNLVRLLQKNRATVIRNSESGEYERKYDIIVRSYPDSLQKYFC